MGSPKTEKPPEAFILTDKLLAALTYDMESVTLQAELVNTPSFDDLPHDDRIASLERELRMMYQENKMLRQEMTWMDDLLSVPASIMSVSCKATVRAVVKHLQGRNANSETDFTEIEARELCKTVGQSKDTFLDNLTYATDKLHIFSKRRNRIEYEKRGGEIGYRSELFVAPKPVLTYPRLYAIDEVRNHGGDRPKCIYCGSEDLDIYQAQMCNACGQTHFKPISVKKTSIPLKRQDDVSQNQQSVKRQDDVSQNQQSVKRQDDVSEDVGETSEIRNVDSPLSYLPLEGEDTVSQASADTVGCIPAELRALPQWCCHRSKLPYDAKIITPLRMKYRLAACDNESTWSTYDQAVETLALSQKWALSYEGVGFMLKKGGGYVFTDYDPDRVTNTLPNPELVYKRVQVTDSYHEFSSSGVGIHGTARGTIPRNIKQPGLEMYSQDKFIVMTGNHVPGTPLEIAERSEQLQALFDEIAPPVVERRAPHHTVSASCGLSGEQVLANCRNGMNGARFEKLWKGDASDYPKDKDGTPDHSKADLALCEELAYRADGDRELVDRLFQQSGLMRPKWERADYRERTLDRAMGVQVSA